MCFQCLRLCILSSANVYKLYRVSLNIIIIIIIIIIAIIISVIIINMFEGDCKLKSIVQASTRQDINVDEDRCLQGCDILPSGRTF